MKLDLALLLPLMAIAALLVFPLFKKTPYSSKSIKSRRHRRILLGRFAVLALPVAAVAGKYSPFPQWDTTARVCLFYALILTPALLFYAYRSWRRSKRRSRSDSALLSDITATDSPHAASNSSDTTESDLRNSQHEKHSNAQSAMAGDSCDIELDGEKVENHSALDEAKTAQDNLDAMEDQPAKIDVDNLPPININSASRGRLPSAEPASPAPSLLIRDPLSGEGISDTESESESNDGTDSPAEVQEQIERVSDLIDSHDLGNTDYSLSDEDLEQKRFALNSDVPLSIESNLTTVETSTSEISKMTTTQISELITNLRSDKTRLQKLVIAQQASLDSERKAHDHSRVVARDAIKIMRDARNGQKFAEKMARRERAERKRLEQQYKKVSAALDNAMSIIETREAEEGA